jgi:hypothetical protein
MTPAVPMKAFYSHSAATLTTCGEPALCLRRRLLGLWLVTRNVARAIRAYGRSDFDLPANADRAQESCQAQFGEGRAAPEGCRV